MRGYEKSREGYSDSGVPLVYLYRYDVDKYISSDLCIRTRRKMSTFGEQMGR